MLARLGGSEVAEGQCARLRGLDGGGEGDWGVIGEGGFVIFTPVIISRGRTPQGVLNFMGDPMFKQG